MGSTIYVRFSSDLLKLDAALWCTLTSEIWEGVKCATFNRKGGSHWDRPPPLSISSSALGGTYVVAAPLSWSQDEGMWSKGSGKAMVDKWREQERHRPCYNPLQLWDSLLPTVTCSPSWLVRILYCTLEKASDPNVSSMNSVVRYTWGWISASIYSNLRQFTLSL